MTKRAKPKSTVRSREMGAELRLRRTKARISGEELTRRLDWPIGKVSYAENGIRPLRELEVAEYLVSCGPVVREDYERLLALSEVPDHGYWVRPHNLDQPVELRSLIVQENIASDIGHYEPLVIPGLLQSESYIRALFHWGSNRPENEIEPRVQARLARQALLDKQLPPGTTFFLQESALRTVVGSPQVMHEQMLLLMMTASQRHCSIRVVRDSAGPFTVFGAFRIMDYVDDHPSVAYTEGFTTGLFIDDATDVARYRRILNRLDSAALSEAQSRTWLAKFASAYDRAEPIPSCPPPE
ncbi:helix-turn-helix domain-containing protein [Amycolatopsis sp. H20-H5]|uniref:helix-turn-helix domain-containing protein n=1 Tax=Amycolatopsis sp. H20-H5 TaxID=3046309 RepID=UPI002DBDEC5A|nr:helix-turn-helix transcriptional regulator [Amycolatopsis sp. H20-H5]MEC3975118.1 helix-turn-helix transcriptional regulator [Amycolatopsis sp. H20-H5]